MSRAHCVIVFLVMSVGWLIEGARASWPIVAALEGSWEQSWEHQDSLGDHFDIS